MLWDFSITKIFVLLLIHKFPKVIAIAQKLTLLLVSGRFYAS